MSRKSTFRAVAISRKLSVQNLSLTLPNCICLSKHNIGTSQFYISKWCLWLISHTLSSWILVHLMMWLLLSACLFTSEIECLLEEMGSISIDIPPLRLSGMDDLPSYSVVPGWLLLFPSFLMELVFYVH